MEGFDELVAKAMAVDELDVGWLSGRLTHGRNPWGYAQLLAGLPRDATVLDIDTGGGEVLARLPTRPERIVATERSRSAVRRARDRLSPLGVLVVQADSRALPFRDASFDVVISRHPLVIDWAELGRVLTRDGRYLAQHVGPSSGAELLEFLLGPEVDRSGRHPRDAVLGAEEAGLRVTHIRVARSRLELLDIGAVVHLLRMVPWWIPDFTVEDYLDRLRELDERIRREGPFLAHTTRYLIEVRH